MQQSQGQSWGYYFWGGIHSYSWHNNPQLIVQSTYTLVTVVSVFMLHNINCLSFTTIDNIYDVIIILLTHLIYELYIYHNYSSVVPFGILSDQSHSCFSPFQSLTISPYPPLTFKISIPQHTITHQQHTHIDTNLALYIYIYDEIIFIILKMQYYYISWV